MVKITTVTALFLALSLPTLACNWKPIGEATLSFWRLKVYTATLYNDIGSYQGIESPIKLSLNYHRSFSADQIYKETRKQFKRLGYSSEKDNAWLRDFHWALPDIEAGHSLSFELQKDNTALLQHNQKPLKRFAARPQNERFLEIWLSENSQEPELRSQLIQSVKF